MNLSCLALWKSYALIPTARQLRQFAPRLWSNLVPHIENSSSFFHEVASNTVKWLKTGRGAIPQNNEPSIYWQLINQHHSRRPICESRNPHLKDINISKLLRKSSTSRLLDFWMLSANYGIHTRSRLGHSDVTRQCHLYTDIETLPHLFTDCSRLAGLFNTLNDRLQLVCGYKINKSVVSIAYLGEITQLSENRSI